MGMIYLLGFLLFIGVFSLIHWGAVAMGWPYGYWISLGGLIVVVLLLSIASGVIRDMKYGTSIVLDEQISIVSLNAPVNAPVNDSDVSSVTPSGHSFSLKSDNLPFRTDVFEIIPEENNRIADGPRVFDDEPKRITIHQFTRRDGAKNYIANRPSDNLSYDAVFWQGEIGEIESAPALDLGGNRVLQAVRLSEDVIVVATVNPEERWKKSVLILNNEGVIVSTLYTGDDLHSRDRAYESRMYLGNEDADISSGRPDSNEYFVPLHIDDENTLIAYGTDTRNYDSFFSTQGYNLPDLTRVFLINDKNPEGTLVARFRLEDGEPVALSYGKDSSEASDVGKTILQTIDARNREDVKVHYYAIDVE